MALIECRECGKSVSDQAPFCPHCGAPVAAQAQGAQSETGNKADGSFSDNGGAAGLSPSDAGVATAVAGTPAPHGRSRRGLIVAGVVVVAVLLVLCGTCPSRTMHEEAVVDELSELMAAEVNSSLGFKGENFFTNLLVTQGAKLVAAQHLRYTSYGILSVAKVQVGSQGSPVSVGVLGCVFPLIDKEKVSALLRKWNPMRSSGAQSLFSIPGAGGGDASPLPDDEGGDGLSGTGAGEDEAFL